MPRKVKCYGPYCEPYGIKHDKENVTKISGKNYCPKCYKYMMKEREQRDKLYNYIAKIYDLPFATPLIKKHIKQLHEQGLSYKKIYALVHYCAEIKKDYRLPDSKYGILILSNQYPEMVRYYKDKKHHKEKNKGKENKKITIRVDSNHFSNNTYKNSKIYDMEEDE